MQLLIDQDWLIQSYFCLFKHEELKGLCHSSPVHFVQFLQLLALSRYGT